MQETLVVSAFVLKHQTPHRSASGCTFGPVPDFDVSATGPAGPLTTSKSGGSVTIQLPEGPRPLTVKLTVTPTGPLAATHWPLEGRLQYLGKAQWRDVDAPP